MPYRPKDWREYYRRWQKEREERNISISNAGRNFEAGADAILEALKRQGQKIDIRAWSTGACYVPCLVIIPAKGHLVFIPDEEAEDAQEG